EVELYSANAGDAVVDRAPDELVAEAVAEQRFWELVDDAAPGGFVDRAAKGARRDVGGGCEEGQVEAGAGDGRELEQRPCFGSHSRNTLVDDVAHAIGAAALGQRLGQPDGVGDLDGAAFEQVAPDLAEKQRRPVAELADRRGQLLGRL